MLGRTGLLLASILLTSCTAERSEFALAVSTEEPAPSIADIISSRLGEERIQVSVNVATNPADIFDSVLDGSVDFGIVEEPDRSIAGIVTIAPLYPSVLHILHNRDLQTQSFVELIRGSNVYAGPVGGAAYRLFRSLASDFGINDDFQILDNPWTVSPDVYFILGGLLSNDSVRQLSGYQLFSFADVGEPPGHSVADAIVLKHHHLKTFLLPKSTYYSLNESPVVTLSVRTVMISRQDFAPDLVTDIVSLLFNNAQEFSTEYPLVSHELDAAMNPSRLMFPLHESTRRFLNRDKPGFIERYVEVIGLVLTLILAVSSGLFALYRRQKQVKKDRVDNYYARILELREKSVFSTDEDQIECYRGNVIEVQARVLNLVIEERLPADASLLAFLSLSNQVINELNRKTNNPTYSGSPPRA